jgi:hypothetical protein
MATVKSDLDFHFGHAVLVSSPKDQRVLKSTANHNGSGSDVRSYTARRETRKLDQPLGISLKEVGQFTVIQTRLRPIAS